MVGSKHGWLDVPYVECPADAAALASQLGCIEAVHIVPGLIFNPPTSIASPPDLMRGEETQLVGALQLRPELMNQSCIVLPGTHSKWAQVKQGQCTGFSTHMTGELYSVLRQFSVLGRLFPSASNEDKNNINNSEDSAAFITGVCAARDQAHLGLSHQLFAVRSLGVTEKMSGLGLSNYLSGLLIGHELKAGLAWRNLAKLAHAPLVLIGEPDLCRRYEQALKKFEIHNTILLPNTAPAGLWSLAITAKLV
jgi:2-dehydro-3-deoxygalactonokinase